MIGLLCVNGILLCPRINMWFEGHNIFGNNLITRAMHKQLPRGRWSIRGIQWWKHFCCFMCMFVFCEGAKKMTTKNSLWKVQRLLDKLNNNAAKMWILGKWFSIDKQTLGFQGRIGIELCISYKKEGDGFQFQCDAVCGDREKPSPSTSAMGIPPLSPLRVQEQDFRPITHSPACRLACSLSYECLVKNFYGQPFQLPEVVQGALLGKVSWARSCANQVAQTTGLDLPPSVRQLEEKNVKDAMKLRGRTAAVRLINSADCPDLFACSVYDTKPAHMLSTVKESMY